MDNNVNSIHELEEENSNAEQELQGTHTYTSEKMMMN